MGTRDESTPAKPPKAAFSSAQEAPTIPAYPDWSSPMQAYYGAGASPPPFYPSTVASPGPHPYIWGAQHPMIPPYGTPVPYPAIYPPGGVYAHPNLAVAPVTAPSATIGCNGKGGDGKDETLAKKSKGGNSGSASGKAVDDARVTSGSDNEGASQSGDSGSEGSSDANEDNNHQKLSTRKKGSFDQMLADGKPAAAGPAKNLNIGMDLWNASSASGAGKMRTNLAPATSGLVPGRMMPDQWMQDERELKRQRRKQSNRESARRSRLRKQTECEELQGRVEMLSNENRSLREELKRLSEECEKLSSDNSSIKDELMRMDGSDALASLEKNSASVGSRAAGENS